MTPENNTSVSQSPESRTDLELDSAHILGGKALKYSRAEKKELKKFSPDMPRLAGQIANEIGVKFLFRIEE